MIIDDQLSAAGFLRKDTGNSVLNYVLEIGNGMSLVCYSEAGGLPQDASSVWFGVSFSHDFTEICGRSYSSGEELASWLAQGRFELKKLTKHNS